MCCVWSYLCACTHVGFVAGLLVFPLPSTEPAEILRFTCRTLQKPGGKQWHRLKGLTSLRLNIPPPFPHPNTHPKPRVYVCISITRPSNIARGHIVKYGTHTKGIYRYNGNGYGYQKLLHINAYAYWVRMHVINLVSPSGFRCRKLFKKKRKMKRSCSEQ